MTLWCALVDVRTDRQLGGVTARQLWVAGVSSKNAVEAVLAKVPLGWAAALSSSTVTLQEMRDLKLRPGDVREIAF